MIVLSLSSTDSYENRLLVIWDTKHNKELSNLSVEESYTYGNGPDSTAGYIFLHGDQNYINLDNKLQNPYFEAQFEEKNYGV